MDSFCFKNKSFFSKHLTTVFFLLFTFIIQAQSTGDFRSFQTGNWNQTATWERYDGSVWVAAASTPTSANGVISILNGHTVTVTANVTIDQTTIMAGGKVILSGGTLTINNGIGDDFVISGTYERTSSTTTMSINSGANVVCADGGTYIHNVAGGSLPTITWQDGSLLNIKNSVNSGNSLVQSFWNVLKEGGNATTVSADNTSRTMTVRNNFEHTGGGFYLKNGGTSGGTHTLSVGGNILHSGGLFGWNSNSVDNTSITNIFIAGDFIIDGTADWGGFVSATQCSSGVFFDGTGTQTFSSRLAFSSGAVRDRFYYKTTGGPTALSEIYTGNIEQWTVNGTCGASPPSGFSRWPTSGSILQNFTVNNTSSSGVNLRNDRTVNDSLILKNGTLSSGANTLTMSNNTNIIRSGGNLATAPTFGANINITYAQHSSSIITGVELPSSASTVKNLTINTTHGVILNGNLTVNDTLFLISGNLSTGSCNAGNTSSTLLTIADNATTSGASSASYVNGVMRKVGNDAFTFPIGDINEYAPVAISAPLSITDEFGACYLNQNPQTDIGTSLQLSIDHVSQCEYWHINRINGTSNVNINLSWDERSCGVTNPSELIVARWDGAEWRNEGNVAFSGNNTAGTLTSGNVSSFSPFTLGSISAGNPLPVELLYFRGNNQSDKNILEWVTVTEIENDYFEVEKSVDGINFVKIGSVEGNGNSTKKHQYIFEDKELMNQMYYYRLKQVDFDGTFEYSKIIAVRSDIVSSFSVFPNPVKELLYVEYHGIIEANFVLYNLLGKKVLSGNLNKSNSINMSNLDKGVYFLRIHDKVEKIVKE